MVRVQGDSIVITKSTDPFKVIEDILGDLTFDRGLRYEAERQAFKELRIVTASGGRSIDDQEGLS